MFPSGIGRLGTLLIVAVLLSIHQSGCAVEGNGPSAIRAAQPPIAERTLTLCTQNLWNYGLPEAVHRLRMPEADLGTLRARLEAQEAALTSRLSGCDLVAVEELVGDESEARSGLENLARSLSTRTGHPYEARTADTRDVIRNGFLVRRDAAFRETEFLGRHSNDRLPVVRGYARGKWDRGPAEIVLTPTGGGTRVRVIAAHLKSKVGRDRPSDPNGEHWERLRILQAKALLDLAKRRLTEHPGDVVVVAGDFNNDRGSATRAVLSGRLVPSDLISPKDCIDSNGRLACPLLPKSPVLIDLADDDPDLRGRGTYRFDGREELIDGFFMSETGASLAREPGSIPGDYDVTIEGRLRSGSDHRLLKVTLHY